MKYKKWDEFPHAKVVCVNARIREIVRMADCIGKTVLDVGCGDGFLSKALQEAGGIVTSIDVDPVKVESCKKNFNINAERSDLCELNIETDSFDIVVGGEILEHIENPFKGLFQMFRIAKNKVIASLPLGAYWLGEKSHKWRVDGTTIEHDTGKKLIHDKEILVLMFSKRPLGT